MYFPRSKRTHVWLKTEPPQWGLKTAFPVKHGSQQTPAAGYNECSCTGQHDRTHCDNKSKSIWACWDHIWLPQTNFRLTKSTARSSGRSGSSHLDSVDQILIPYTPRETSPVTSEWSNNMKSDGFYFETPIRIPEKNISYIENLYMAICVWWPIRLPLSTSTYIYELQYNSIWEKWAWYNTGATWEVQLHAIFWIPTLLCIAACSICLPCESNSLP